MSLPVYALSLDPPRSWAVPAGFHRLRVPLRDLALDGSASGILSAPCWLVLHQDRGMSQRQLGYIYGPDYCAAMGAPPPEELIPGSCTALVRVNDLEPVWTWPEGPPAPEGRGMVEAWAVDFHLGWGWWLDQSMVFHGRLDRRSPLWEPDSQLLGSIWAARTGREFQL